MKRTILIDTDEKRRMPLPSDCYGTEWSGIKQYMQTGDYTIEGWSDYIRVERKSLEDLMSCLTAVKESGRLADQLRRMKKFAVPLFLIEADRRNVLDFQISKQAKLRPEQLWSRRKSLLEFERACARINMPVAWIGPRSTKTPIIWSAILESLLAQVAELEVNPHDKRPRLSSGNFSYPDRTANSPNIRASIACDDAPLCQPDFGAGHAEMS